MRPLSKLHKSANVLNEKVSRVAAGRIFARSVNYVAVSKRARYDFGFLGKAYFSLVGV